MDHTNKLKLITVTLWWAQWRLKSPVSRLFAQPFVQAQIKKHQSSASLAFVREIQRWPVASLTKGQKRRKCFHLMTSSCGKTTTSNKQSNILYGMYSILVQWPCHIIPFLLGWPWRRRPWGQGQGPVGNGCCTDQTPLHPLRATWHQGCYPPPSKEPKESVESKLKWFRCHTWVSDQKFHWPLLLTWINFNPSMDK